MGMMKMLALPKWGGYSLRKALRCCHGFDGTKKDDNGKQGRTGVGLRCDSRARSDLCKTGSLGNNGGAKNPYSVGRLHILRHTAKSMASDKPCVICGNRCNSAANEKPHRKWKKNLYSRNRRAVKCWRRQIARNVWLANLRLQRSKCQGKNYLIPKAVAA